MVRWRLLWLLCLWLPAVEAQAGGVEIPDLGAVTLGRGGTSVASVSDASALYTNPANLLWMGGFSFFGGSNFIVRSDRFVRAGLDQRIIPDENGELESPGFAERYERPFAAVESRCESSALCTPVGFALPHVFAGYSHGDWAIALGVYPPPALGGVDYASDGPQRYAFVSQDLSLVWFALGGAYRVGDWRFGLAVQMGRLDMAYTLTLDANLNAMQDVISRDYRGESSPYYTQAMDVPVALNAGAWAPAAVLGVGWEPWRELGLALSVQTAARFDLEGEVALDFSGSAIPGHLAHLTDNRASVTYHHPWIVRFGALWRYFCGDASCLDVEVNLVYESWSLNDVWSVDLPGSLGGGGDAIGRIPLPKHWQDVWSLRLGGELRPLPWLSARAGGYLERGAVPMETTNLDTLSHHRAALTVGASLHLPADFDIHLGYGHVFQAPREVRRSLIRTHIPTSSCGYPYDDAAACPVLGEGPGEPVGAGRYESAYDLWSLALGYRY